MARNFEGQDVPPPHPTPINSSINSSVNSSDQLFRSILPINSSGVGGGAFSICDFNPPSLLHTSRTPQEEEEEEEEEED